MPPDQPLVTERDLARTYDGGVYDDAWAAVEQYRDVDRYRSANPETGYTAIASAVDLPTGRVRSWYEGKTPRVVGAIDTACDRGWVGVDFDDRTFNALNALVAGIFSGGSINHDNWAPKWMLNGRAYDSFIVDALELAGVGHTTHDPGCDDTAPAIRPAADGAVLGRILYVLGAPIGTKSDLNTLTLPWYLDHAPPADRELFVQCYLANRGYRGQDSAHIQINEERCRTYQRELVALLDDVADGEVRLGESTISISAAAARSIQSDRETDPAG